ncbi:MAG TPA: site-2 protease family protein [Natronosporangium sp.]
MLGFPLYLRWSVLLLMGLVVLLSGEEIGYGVGFGFVVCLLLSVLLHELGHAVTARRLGIGVRGITLEILGGYTEMDREAPTPRAELAVSLAGPAVSLAVGVVAGAGAAVLPDGAPRQIAFLVAIANVIVAAFNVLPGLPLDGGRALRAAVWWVSRSKQRGTAVAARGGQVVAGVTVVAAVWLYATGLVSFFGLVLMVLVAASLWQGASLSARVARVSGRLPLIDVDRLTRPIYAVPTGTPLAEAQRRAVEFAPPEAALAVADSSGRLVGLVHPGAADAVPEARRPWVTVDSVARELAAIRAVPSGLRGADALNFLQADPAGEYLVTTNGEVVGVLRAADVARVLRERRPPRGREPGVGR